MFIYVLFITYKIPFTYSFPYNFYSPHNMQINLFFRCLLAASLLPRSLFISIWVRNRCILATANSQCDLLISLYRLHIKFATTVQFAYPIINEDVKIMNATNQTMTWV